MEVEAQKWHVAMTQEVYTPEDLQQPTPPPDDRPYAGWLYATVRWQRRGTGPGRWLVRDQANLDLGFVGQESLVEETQKAFHHQFPQGWDHQLTGEFGFNARYQRQYFYTTRRPGRDWNVDFIPQGDISAGNVDSHLGAGGFVRFGFRVPNEVEAVAGKSSTPPNT